MEPTDEALLHAWRDGDKAAGRVLFERHHPTVFRFFASKVGDAAAEDLTQRTFVTLVESRDRVREGQRLRAYLLTVAKNHLFMLLRAKGRRGAHVALEQSCVDELLPSPSSAIAGNEQERLVVQALRRIPLEQQMLLELHYWEELSTEELAELLAIPRGTVKSRLFTARDEVRRTLARLSRDEMRQASSVEDFEHWALVLRDRPVPKRSP